MKLLVCGSRDYIDYVDFSRRLTAHLDLLGFDPPQPEQGEIISGGARDADRMAEWYCRNRGLKNTIMPADWSRGKGAGYQRNIDMLSVADRVVAFWDGESRGAKHTIDSARRLAPPTTVIQVGR